MTQEDKELLLKDLSARLPYGVICQYIKSDGETVDMAFKGKHFDYSIICKPYLRPMSSMTEEENVEYNNTKTCHIGRDNCTYTHSTLKTLDWLNKKGFDYRGLIPMGLALEAPKDMYK